MTNTTSEEKMEIKYRTAPNGAPMERGPVFAIGCAILFCGAVNVALMSTHLTSGKRKKSQEKGDNGK